MSTTGAPWGIRFSQRTVMAINGAVALAKHAERRLVSTETLAAESGAPAAKMDAVFNQLQKAGLLRSNGNGSVAWRRDPDTVSLHDIAAAVGERFQFFCSMRGEAPLTGLCKQCPMKCLSRSLKSEVVDLFKARRLSDLSPAQA